MILATRPASIHDTPIGMIFIFSREVWALIFLTAIVVACFAITTVIFHQKKPEKRLKIYTETVIESASVFSGQSVSDTRTMTMSGRFSIGIWCLMTIVLAGTYSAHILASLIVHKLDPPFNDLSSLADCVARDECRLVHTSRSVSNLATLFETESKLLSRDQLKLRDALGRIEAVEVYERTVLTKKLLFDYCRFRM